MTQAPERTPAALATPADAYTLLRGSGHRVTAPARLVIQALFDADRPISAEEIAELTGIELDASSVYRNLERLQQLGIVSHVHPGHGPGLYAIARGNDPHYLVCDRCHGLTPLGQAHLDTIRDTLQAGVGHHADFSHFPIHGICARCAHDQNGVDVATDHDHAAPHTHAHTHGDTAHEHPHTTHAHDHVEHEHEHRHGELAHSHPHVHEQGLEQDHRHPHA